MRYEQIAVLVPSDRMRAWAPRLAEVLQARFAVPVALSRLSGSTAPPPLPSEGLEARVLGAPGQGHGAWRPSGDVPVLQDPLPSGCLVVNATERDPSALPAGTRAATILTPTFNGAFALDGLIASLLSGEPPHLGVVAVTQGRTRLLHGAYLAMPDLLLRALDAVLARTLSFLRDVTDHLVTAKPLPEPVAAPVPTPAPAGPGFWSRRILGTYLPRAGREVRKRFTRTEDWCIGYRQAGPARDTQTLDLDPASFSLVEPDRSHFYADPFVLSHEGTTALFFENYDFATGLGRIDYAVLGADGGIGKPAEALARPYHLSYPFVFCHEGAALMVPETAANRTIELYEAESFPARWRLRSVLVDNIDAVDSTLHFDPASGLWWMFCAVSEFGGSLNDTLSIFFSERLEGDWRPHPANPVKIDPASSRPAGPILACDGHLFRPAQDCTRGYGSGLALCEIEELTPSKFRERLVARRYPSDYPSGGYSGLHTYCRGSGFEVIDLKRVDLHRPTLTNRGRLVSS